jgi:hypothetical protein
MLVEVEATLCIGWCIHGQPLTYAPTQVKQTLDMIGVEMGQEYSIERPGWKPLTQIVLACIQQVVLIPCLKQGTARRTL